MAEIPVPNVDIITTSTGAYKWSGFVRAVLSGGDELDDIIIPNRLSGRRQPTYCRVQTPVQFVQDPEQPGPVALADGLGAWPEYVADGVPVAERVHMEDNVLTGPNSVWFCAVETGAAPQTARVFFVEYGIEHSVEK